MPEPCLYKPRAPQTLPFLPAPLPLWVSRTASSLPWGCSCICQGFIRSFLLSAEDSDTQSPGSEDQQVSLPCAVQAGEKVGPSNSPLTHQLLPCLHTACICPSGHQRGSPVPHAARLRQGICGFMGSVVEAGAGSGSPAGSSALTKAAPSLRAALRGVQRRRKASRTRWALPMCLHSPGSLATQLSEVRRVPSVGWGCGQGAHASARILLSCHSAGSTCGDRGRG